MAGTFSGSSICPLDEKFRAVLPRKFRDSIEPDRLREGFVVTLGFDDCLVMYLKEEWRHLVNCYKKLPYTDPDARLFKRFFFPMATDVTLDRVGRITIAEFQREAVGIDRELVFNGVDDCIEIWAPEKWNQFFNQRHEDYSKAAAQLTKTYGVNLNGSSLPGAVAPGGTGWKPPSSGGGD